MLLRSLFALLSCLLAATGISAMQAGTPPDSLSQDPHMWRVIEPAPRVQMDAAEIARELKDPWWMLVLSKPPRPLTLSESIAAINAAAPSFTQKNYLVGEGSQIPVSTAVPRDVDRSLRYSMLWQKDSQIQILASSSTPSTAPSFLQVIAWDANKKKFNFYERFSFPNGTYYWAWTGDSSFARRPEFRGQGCFECHHNGVPIMKELFRPWNNWDSELASFDPAVVPENVAQDPPFKNLKSASELETDVKAAAIVYFNAWLNEHVNDDVTSVKDVPELLAHLTSNTTLNFGSALQQSRSPSASIHIPTDFFVYDSFFRSLNIGLKYEFPSEIHFKADAYSQFLSDHQFKLRQCHLTVDKLACRDGSLAFEVAGSSFFAGFVPVPSNDDSTVLNAFLFSSGIGKPPRSLELLSKKFIVSVLMVDFPNPVFSKKRASLQKYTNEIKSASISNGSSNIPALFAAKVQAAAAHMVPCTPATLDDCSPEQQFLFFWLDAGWKKKAESAIGLYLQAVSRKIQQPTGADDFLRLTVSRRFEFSSTPLIKNLFEFSLLSPQTNLPAVSLRMKTDGSVVPKKP